MALARLAALVDDDTRCKVSITHWQWSNDMTTASAPSRRLMMVMSGSAAAHALAINVTLVTNNTPDFSLYGVPLENWTKTT